MPTWMKRLRHMDEPAHLYNDGKLAIVGLMQIQPLCGNGHFQKAMLFKPKEITRYCPDCSKLIQKRSK